MSQNTVDHTNPPVDHRAVVESVRSARSFELELPIVGAIPVPRPEQIAYFAVMGLMVAFEIIEWPVAVTIAAGASARNRAAQSRPRRDRRGARGRLTQALPGHKSSGPPAFRGTARRAEKLTARVRASCRVRLLR